MESYTNPANDNISQDEYLMNLYAQKASRGDAESQFRLALHYLNHHDNDRENMKFAFINSGKAAVQHHSDAQVLLALFYMKGFFVNKNVNTAIRWLKIAARNSNLNAQIELAKIYFTGMKSPKNINQALKFARQAAVKNNPFGHFILYLIYAIQLGDSTKAEFHHERMKQLSTPDIAAAIEILRQDLCGIRLSTIDGVEIVDQKNNPII